MSFLPKDSANDSDSPPALAREQWIAACHFHDLTPQGVLEEVYRRVSEVRARAFAQGLGKPAHPLVLLDLDSTLYEVGPRTFRILQEWAAAEESAVFPEVRAALARLSVAGVGYSIGDTFAALGLDDQTPQGAKAAEAAKAFWSKRFFTSQYLPFDHAYPGAAEFTRELYRLGAEIVYLTGRDAPGMGDGTRANLLRDGFPWGVERTHLLLKAASHLPDLKHKQDAAAYIRQHGTLVASFENEPPNLIALSEIFPEAMHVFVDTICSDHVARPARGLYRLEEFHVGK